MKQPPELFVLALICLITAMMWLPYVVARIMKTGMFLAPGNPNPAFTSVAPWAQRSQKAHANAVENLVVFAPLVLIAAFLGVSTPSTLWAAKIYLIARLIHYAVYTAGLSVIRTLAFLVGFGATLTFAIVILSSVF